MLAYDVEDYQVSGASWMDSERYDIVAKVPTGATKGQVRVMWQNLLAERFGAKLHHESKEFRVEELVTAKGGHKLKEVPPDPNEEGPPDFQNGRLNGPGLVTMMETRADGPHARSVAKAQPLSKLTTMLWNQLRVPVLDKTGLTGRYDFDLEYTPRLNGVAPSAGASDPAPDIEDAIQRQLGLRLVASKAKLDVLTIDQANKVPTAN